MSEEDLETIKRHYMTHTHKQIAEMIGRSQHAVRNACSENGWIKRNDRWSDADLAKLITWYMDPKHQSRDTLRLDDLAKDLGRGKTSVCCKAKAIGLTNVRRTFELEETRKRHSEQATKRIRENGHPRGALGLKHSPETLEVLSKKSRDSWKERKRMPILGAIRRVKTARTNIERYGSASPVHGINGGRNVYSRCRRGVRDDLGFFVRSRWEANYARYLKWLEERGEIAAWEYEPLTFHFEGVKRGPYTYKPDFKVVEKDGVVAFHEVKGWMDSKSRGKLKRFAKFYPHHKLVVIDQKTYKEIERSVSSVIQNWEAE